MNTFFLERIYHGKADKGVFMAENVIKCIRHSLYRSKTMRYQTVEQIDREMR